MKTCPRNTFMVGRRGGDRGLRAGVAISAPDRKSTRLNSSRQIISYAVFCLKKKNTAHAQGYENDLHRGKRYHDSHSPLEWRPSRRTYPLVELWMRLMQRPSPQMSGRLLSPS